MRPLTRETADIVAQHLVAAGELAATDPAAAHEHAKYAAIRGSRVAGVREAAGIIIYHLGQYDEALRELRTHRRISGSDDNLPLIADAERGRGRPQKALELFEEASEDSLGHDLYTELLMVAAGAHMDLGQVREARALLETRNFAGNANGTLVRLLSVYSDVLRLQGETDLADRYEELARRTARATGTLFGDEDIDPNEGVTIVTLEEIELPEEDSEVVSAGASDEEAGEASAEASAETPTEAAAAEDAPENTAAEETAPVPDRATDEAPAEEAAEGASEDATPAFAEAPQESEAPEAAQPQDDAEVRARLAEVDAEFDQDIVDELEEILNAPASAAVSAAEPGTVPEPTAEEESAPASEPAPESATKAKAEAEPKAQAEPKAEPETVAQSESDPETEPEPKARTTKKAQAQTAPEASRKPEPDPEPAAPAAPAATASTEEEDDGFDADEELTEPLFDL